MNIDLKAKPFLLNDSQAAWVDETFSRMTDREKAGQLFIINGSGYQEEELNKIVGEYNIGGLLFRPTETLDKVRAGFDRLDGIAKFPLLKAANLETGGIGIASDGTFFSSQAGVSAADSSEAAEHFADTCAYEGAKAGVNLTFSPVSDISRNFFNPIIPTRSFGTDIEKVRAYTRIYVEHVQAAGIAASAKHFPGDGIDFRDQHLHPTYNTLSKDEWYATFGDIYSNMIDAGLLSVMVGHICQPEVQMDINPSLSPEECLPGSLSKELLQGVLRGKLGFNGMIITDATIMTGFTNSLPRKQGIPAAIEAGCDMICFNMDFYEDYGFVLEALENGTLSHERLDEAVYRVLALKAKVALCPPEFKGAPNINEWVKDAADRSVTLVKNKKNVVPLSTEKYESINIISIGDDKLPGGESLAEYVAGKLTAEGFKVSIFDPKSGKFGFSFKGMSTLDPKELTLYLANMGDISNNTATRLFWKAPHAQDVPRYVNELDYLFVSFAYPYHLYDIPRIPAYINAYAATKAVADAVIEKIMGRSEFKGVNPVDPFCGMIDTRL